MKTIFIGCDHAGFQTKLSIIEFLESKFPQFQIENCGCNSQERTDYTIYSKAVAENVAKNQNSVGILICGSGIGVSMAANKKKNVRAALIYNNEVASLARQHNNANIACFAARMFSHQQINQMLELFLKAEFLGGVHLQRIENLEI